MIIGVTGLIGSGKSTVCEMMAELGAKTINSDELGHQIYLPGTPGFEAVVKEFGNEIIDENGFINRKKLSNIVFEDEKKLKTLNKITHPLIREAIKEKIEEYKKENADVICLEAALLIESGYQDLVDKVWLTTAPQDLIIERLKSSRNMDKADVLRRIRQQLPIEKLREEADEIIATANPLSEVKNRVVYLYQHL